MTNKKMEMNDYPYEKAETYTQAEVNAVVSGAIDALNIEQYRTEGEVNAAVTSALEPFYTSVETDSAISAAVDDARYFPVNGNTESGSTFTLMLEAYTPRVIRALAPTLPTALGSARARARVISGRGSFSRSCLPPRLSRGRGL